MAKQEVKKNAKAKKQNFFVRTFKRIVSFFSGVIAELKKVSWPTKKELASQTGVVIVVVAIVACYIWILDTVFGFLRNLI